MGVFRAHLCTDGAERVCEAQDGGTRLVPEPPSAAYSEPRASGLLELHLWSEGVIVTREKV